MKISTFAFTFASIYAPPITVPNRTKNSKAKYLVSEPITIIIGAPDLFVNKGSTINLTCVVKYAPEPPPMMIWSHNTEVGIAKIIINYRKFNDSKFNYVANLPVRCEQDVRVTR